MSEHNVSKPRTCKTCNQVIVGTANDIKAHSALHERNGPMAKILKAIGESEKEALRVRYGVKAA